jgi:hypothetical protein
VDLDLTLEPGKRGWLLGERAGISWTKAPSVTLDPTLEPGKQRQLLDEGVGILLLGLDFWGFALMLVIFDCMTWQVHFSGP